jgi:hypothetical protein
VPPLPAGRQLFFGFLLSGTGKGWVDDLELLVDGVPVAQAAPRIPTVFDNDREFDQGSGIHIINLSELQIRNLAMLGKVWGFLKYHHPAVTGGLHHWDYELFRIAPQILEAADTEAAVAAILAWVQRLGPIEECAPCAGLNSNDLYLPPNVDWIGDTTLLGFDLSQTLETIYRNRKPLARQFYVSLASNVGNPIFDNELPYGTLRFPDSGYQLLALFRFWNMVQYFYPNRDIMSDDTAQAAEYWNRVLEEFIPRITLAPAPVSYHQELMRFIAKINDTHANLWSSLASRPPIGVCQLPVDVRFVEGRPIVLRDISITTTMAFRTATDAIVIGSTTAGADGNVSTVPLPGGLSSYISGIGVFYPDRRPTQRIGILPDIQVTPTIEGIRAGRDELLEEAIRQIVSQ